MSKLIQTGVKGITRAALTKRLRDLQSQELTKIQAIVAQISTESLQANQHTVQTSEVKAPANIPNYSRATGR